MSIEPALREAHDLYMNNRFTDAAEAAFRLLEQAPDNRHALRLLADSCYMAGYVDESERAYRLLLQRERTPFALTGLAIVASARGQQQEAEDLLRQVFQIDPAHHRAWETIPAVHKFREGDPLLRKAQRMLKRKDIDQKSRVALCYAMVKAMNDLGKWDKAWDWALEAGNAAKPDYDPIELTNAVSELRQVLDPDFLSPRPGRGLATRAPIFVLGMPRSGTTLMEMILVSSGQVAGLGELATIMQISSAAAGADARLGNPRSLSSWMRRWRDDAFTEAATFYLAEVERRCRYMPGNFVDKMPGNVFALGQIGLMFPEARIIRMHRDPLDVCVSCLLGHFGIGHLYSYRPEWLGEAWRAYRDAADLQCPMIPNPVLDVHYEKLVGAPEAETRRIFQFLELEWTPKVLNPAAADHFTTTRSRGEVRNAISTRSVGRWMRYKNRIGPLAEALGIDIEKRLAA